MPAIGYDPDFLSIEVALPRPTDDRTIVDLPYPHFTVLLDPERRLAASTGVNIDGRALIDMDRADDWHFDERVPASSQAGPQIYARNDLDRGHLVRRRDPVWGEPAVAAAANEATFAFTNAAPQAALFNQGPTLWVGLEDHVLNYARATEQKISVFTGPVLAADDPPYRGIQIPRRFWKIAAWTARTDSERPRLRAAGFVVDQGPALDALDLNGPRVAVDEDPPPLEPFLTFQVPISDIAALAAIDVAELGRADRMTAAPGALSSGPWHLIERGSDIQL
jgi:endonuclease G, mitochondrial